LKKQQINVTNVHDILEQTNKQNVQTHCWQIQHTIDEFWNTTVINTPAAHAIWRTIYWIQPIAGMVKQSF